MSPQPPILRRESAAASPRHARLLLMLAAALSAPLLLSPSSRALSAAPLLPFSSAPLPPASPSPRCAPPRAPPPPDDGLEPLEALLADLRAWHRGVTQQQSLANYVEVVTLLRALAPARALVFGLGNDSPFYVRANAGAGAETVFVESEQRWIEEVLAAHPAAMARAGVRVLQHSYASAATNVRDAPALLRLGATQRRERLLMAALPADVLAGGFDVLLVDAPDGSSPLAPGRLASIFTAGVLARRGGRACGRARVVFVHDVDRAVERAAVAAFFPSSLVARNETVDKLLRIDIAEGAAEDDDGGAPSAEGGALG